MRGWVMAVTLDEKRELRSHGAIPAEHVVQQSGWCSVQSNRRYFRVGVWHELVQSKYGCTVNPHYIPSANRVPVASANADKTIGKTPLTVKFNGDATVDPDGDELKYEWNFGDGGTSTEKNHHEYKKAGEYKEFYRFRSIGEKKALRRCRWLLVTICPTWQSTLLATANFWDNAKFDYSVDEGQWRWFIGNGIDPKSITFTADYLARGKDVTEVIQGHQVNMEASPTHWQDFVPRSDCKSCHHATEKSAGSRPWKPLPISMQATRQRWKFWLIK